MAHMRPEYATSLKWLVERPDGGSERFDELSDAYELIMHDTDIGNGESYVLIAEKGWWARLSASGYLDCTDWHGPFPGLEEARNCIVDTYDVHPDTGEDLGEDADLWQAANHQAPATQETM